EAIITFDSTIRLVANEETKLQAQRFARFELVSLPFGAEIHAGWKYLGTTPITIIREMQSLPVSVQKSGFVPVETTLSPCKRTTLTLEKQHKDSLKISLLQKLPTKEYRWLSVLGGTATIAGLVYSVQNKFKADDLYDLYKESGDPTLRPQIRALDTRAGWGLAIAQTGLVVVAIRLVLK
ncbi:MAG TPA: PEGA domain-containing protein, partial [Rhodothermales bacterium]|nr:PEGA domain-containing protein [Rhodothermales bacterium]